MFNAAVIPARCNNRSLYGMTVEESPSCDWVRVWAFPMTERQMSHEGYGNASIQGSLDATEAYPGCPYCKGKGFVECYSCGKITCYHGESSLVCAWCGTTMSSFYTGSRFDQSGGAL